jgi:hypothetical protein
MRTTTPTALLAALALALGSSACSRRPARFADAPPVTRAADDAPTPAPRPLDPLDAIFLTEAYLHRPLVEALDPERVPDAKDVNALDEVPRSSWFRPPAAGPASEPSELVTHGAPVPPLTVTEHDLSDDALPVRDARGVAYLLVRDPPDRPEMATGAAVVASRLLRALGWITAETSLVEVARKDVVAARLPALPGKPASPEPPTAAVEAFFHPEKGVASERLRVAAVEWPVGIDLGPTPSTGTRKDDPNDTIAHTERRTLRALGTVGAWLRLRRMGKSTLRDAYVGVPGQGHVLHVLVRLDAALGAGSVVRPQDLNDPDPEDLDGLRDLVTLGLAPKNVPPTQTRWPALGELDEVLLAHDARPSPPIDAVDRVQPADAYWAAKRVMALPDSVIGAALDAARYKDPAVRAELGRLVAARRVAVFAKATDAVTPCEVERVTGERLTLRDEAVRFGVVPATARRYGVLLVDADGEALARPVGTHPTAGLFQVDLRPALRAAVPYFIVTVLAFTDGHAAPRRFEAHFVRGEGGVKLVGVRH